VTSSWGLGAHHNLTKDCCVVLGVVGQAEGLEQYFSSSLLVEVPSSGLFLGHLDFFFPADVVAGSERAEVTVVGT